MDRTVLIRVEKKQKQIDEWMGKLATWIESHHATHEQLLARMDAIEAKQTEGQGEDKPATIHTQERSADWRLHPATQPQLNKATYLGIRIPNNPTKGQISDLIAATEAMRNVGSEALKKHREGK